VYGPRTSPSIIVLGDVRHSMTSRSAEKQADKAGVNNSAVHAGPRAVPGPVRY
jgi:hypothetical protein